METLLPSSILHPLPQVVRKFHQRPGGGAGAHRQDLLPAREGEGGDLRGVRAGGQGEAAAPAPVPGGARQRHQARDHPEERDAGHPELPAQSGDVQEAHPLRLQQPPADPTRGLQSGVPGEASIF